MESIPEYMSNEKHKNFFISNYYGIYPGQSFSQNQGTISLYFNPFKLFLGVINIGVEFHLNEHYPMYIASEYALRKTQYLEKIGHPLLVAKIGYKYFIKGELYIQPRGIIHYRIGKSDFIYGGEAILGLNL